MDYSSLCLLGPVATPATLHLHTGKPDVLRSKYLWENPSAKATWEFHIP